MIKLVVLDIVGVLTDGTIIVDEEGKEYKKLSFFDIDGVFKIKRLGFKLAFLTGESTKITSYFKRRFNPDYFYDACKNKYGVLKEILKKEGLGLAEVCYVGDGVSDIEAIGSVGLGCCPANAHKKVREKAKVVLKEKSGEGVVSVVAEMLEKMSKQEGHE